MSFAFKKHPRHKGAETEVRMLYDELFGDCEELPQYIAAELLLNNVRKNVIAVSSTPLVVASQLEHLRAVSLLELVEWYHEESKNRMKNDLIKRSKNRIIFVKSLEELREVITGSK